MNQQNQVSLNDVVANIVRTIYKLQDNIEQLANENTALKAKVKELEAQDKAE